MLTQVPKEDVTRPVAAAWHPLESEPSSDVICADADAARTTGMSVERLVNRILNVGTVSRKRGKTVMGREKQGGSAKMAQGALLPERCCAF